MSTERYRVIEQLAAGGMAEVFVGEAASVRGFKKKVAIKRVLPHLAENEKFMGMFLDEARLGAKLNHANIVTVFDIGSTDNTYFIVMEFVDGCDLTKILDTLRETGRRFPAKEAIYIAMETCHGLNYAHELVDDNQKPLGIVHRDVSPPNILISKRGEVKMTDFGLAKARTQLETTDPGVVKGKFSYLSPEATEGKDVDARADVFALGVVLWEMLAGRKLFKGETDLETIKLVQKAEIPSITRLNPSLGAEFEGIINKALAKNLDQRYANAAEFGDALAGYLFKHQLKVTRYDIAKLITGILDTPADAVAPANQSELDRLIQEELFNFTSIAHTNVETGFEKNKEPTGTFINPHDWFGEDQDVVSALEEATGQASMPPTLNRAPSNRPLRAADPAPKPAQVSTPPVAPTSKAQPASPKAATPHPNFVAPPPTNSAQPAITTQPSVSHAAPKKSGMTATLIAIVATVLVLAGVVAYLALNR